MKLESLNENLLQVNVLKHKLQKLHGTCFQKLVAEDFTEQKSSKYTENINFKYYNGNIQDYRYGAEFILTYKII